MLNRFCISFCNCIYILYLYGIIRIYDKLLNFIKGDEQGEKIYFGYADYGYRGNIFVYGGIG